MRFCGFHRSSAAGSAGGRAAAGAGDRGWLFAVISAVMLASRQAPDLICGHWLLLERLGAVPRVLVWDNESAVGSWRAGRSRLTAEFEAFRGMLVIRVIQRRPRDSETKGLVERASGSLETSFLPGRSVTCPADFNTPQLEDWLARANGRQHRRLGCRPLDRFDADRFRCHRLAAQSVGKSGYLLHVGRGSRDM